MQISEMIPKEKQQFLNLQLLCGLTSTNLVDTEQLKSMLEAEKQGKLDEINKIVEQIDLRLSLLDNLEQGIWR